MSSRLPRNLAQAAEEFGTVARQLLHLAGERGVEALAQLRDLDALVFSLSLRDLHAALMSATAGAAQDLLVQELDRFCASVLSSSFSVFVVADLLHQLVAQASIAATSVSSALIFALSASIAL